MHRAPNDPATQAGAEELIEALKDGANARQEYALEMLEGIYEDGLLVPRDLVAAYAYTAAAIAVDKQEPARTQAWRLGSWTPLERNSTPPKRQSQ